MIVALASLARAQDPTLPELNAQIVHLSVDGATTLTTDDTHLAESLTGTARVMALYTKDPFVFEQADGTRVALLSDVVQTDLLAGFTWSRVRLGVDVPVFLVASGDLGGGAGLGDLALDLKAVGLSRDDLPVGVGVTGRLALPTSTTVAPVGGAGISYEVAVVADAALGPVAAAVNVGTRGTPAQALDNILVNDQLVMRGGLSWAITPAAGVTAELSSLLAYSAPLANPAGAPTEWLASGWGRVSPDLVVRGGVGAGLTPGIGSPNLRALVSLGYEPGRPGDTDGDGFVDDDDGCPLDREDDDGWEDADGCPEPDNDGDGLIDASDECPDEAEDLDTWSDDDGCPDPGVRVTLRVTGPNGERLDGVNVTVSAEKQRYTGGGEIVRELVPGEYRVVASASGLSSLDAAFIVDPGPPQVVDFKLRPKATKVVVQRDRIDLKESVFFEVGNAVIKPESFGLLDEITQILVGYPEIVRLRIEGHTDTRGDDAANLRLSELRSASVRQYFLDRGIAPERLTSVGFGETRPLDAREVPEAWDKNRRVDFFVEQWVDR
jgi:outer membrane protein OmpA-like peptidoglycan-associated protein